MAKSKAKGKGKVSYPKDMKVGMKKMMGKKKSC